MKKFVSVLMCLMMLLSLFSCRTAEEQEIGSDTTDSASSTLNVDAMQPYPPEITGELIDTVLEESDPNAFQFLSAAMGLDESAILYKTVLDMDGDGIDESVIRLENKEHIVLHSYDGKLYGYRFDSMSFFNLNDDGSFYWIDSNDVSDCTRGCNRITFDGAVCHVKELYRIKQTSPYDYGDGDHEYYIDGKQVTHKEFKDYYNTNCRRKDLAIFTPVDLSCEYPISSGKAGEIASNHWGVKSGSTDGTAGTVYLSQIVILEKPSNDTPSYRVGLYWEGYQTHVIDDLFGQPPSREGRIYEELIVDAITGECREHTDTDSDKNG